MLRGAERTARLSSRVDFIASRGWLPDPLSPRGGSTLSGGVRIPQTRRRSPGRFRLSKLRAAPALHRHKIFPDWGQTTCVHSVRCVYYTMRNAPDTGETTMRQVWTYDLARAASQDAANRRMRKGGRTAWNRADYNHAIDEFNRLYPIEEELQDRGS